MSNTIIDTNGKTVTEEDFIASWVDRVCIFGYLSNKVDIRDDFGYMQLLDAVSDMAERKFDAIKISQDN